MPEKEVSSNGLSDKLFHRLSRWGVLLWCECHKLKRRKFFLFIALAACLFPIAVTLLLATPEQMQEYSSKAEVFDGLYQFCLGYAVELLLPCFIGVAAASLFFLERDHNTFKSLRTIPVSSTEMVTVKILLLFLISIVFCLLTTLVLTVCGSVIAEVHGLAYKIGMAVAVGLQITAGTLPLVVVIVFCSRTYIFSVLLCVFYSVFSLTVESLFEVIPKALCWLLPIPLTTLWTGGNMVAHGFSLNIGPLLSMIPSNAQMVAILGSMTLVSLFLIDQLYKREGG